MITYRYMNNKEMEIGSVDSKELNISRRAALAKFAQIGIVASASVMNLTACGGWSSSSASSEVAVSDKTEDINEKRVKEGLDFPENGVVNITKDDGILYYTLENSSEASLEMLEYTENSVLTSDQSKNITWEYATFQVKDGNLKVKVIEEPQETVTYVLSIVEGDKVREVTFNIIPEGGEAVNTAPLAIDWIIEWEWASSITFSMADFISDAEDADSNLTIEITQEPGNLVDWELTVSWTLDIDWIDVTYNMFEWHGWSSYFKFKSVDKEWLKSEEKQILLTDFMNF